MKNIIRSVVVTIALGVSIPTLAQAATATRIDFLKPQDVGVQSFDNAGYYEISPIKPTKYWEMHLTLDAPPSGVKAIIYTLKDGTFSNGKTKLETSTGKDVTLISKKPHVYLYFNNYIPLSYVANLLENKAVAQEKTTYVYPWHHGYLYHNHAAEKNLLDNLIHYETPSVAYVSSAVITATKNETVFRFRYYESASDVKTVKAKVKSLLPQIIKPGMDAFQKEFAIHNWIASHVSYDFSKTDPQNTDYTAITKGKSDCAGVTMLTYQMLTAAGITNRMVPGNLHGGTYVLRGKIYHEVVPVSDTLHIWNEVKLNGKWYMLDVTNDLANLNASKIGYDFYNLTSAQLSNTHTWNHVMFPAANTNFMSVLQRSRTKQDQTILKVIQG